MTLLITRESLSRACYHRDERAALLEAVVPPEGLPVTRASAELARAAGIPDRDIHWSLCYGLAPTHELDRAWREHACAMVRRVLESERAAGREPHADSWRAVEVAERFARGEATRKELDAAAIVDDLTVDLAAVAHAAADLAAALADASSNHASYRAFVDDLVARLEVLP